MFLRDKLLLMYLEIVGMLFLSVSANAQLDTLQWSQGKRLQYQDFSVGARANYIDIALHYAYEVEPALGGKLQPIVTAQAVFNRSTSSLTDSMDYHLRYAQLLFDLEGYATKRLKARVVELGTFKGTPERLKSTLDGIFHQVSQEIQQLRSDLNQDLEDSDNPQSVLERWEYKVHNLLKVTPDVEMVQNRSNWQVGLLVGIGRHIFTGNTKINFSDATSFVFGFGGDIRNSRLLMDFALGANKALRYIQESKGQWESGTRTNFAGIALTYGRKIQKKDWLVVPFLGMAVNEFTPAKSSQEDLRRLIGYSPVLGLELGRYFKKSVNFKEEVLCSYRGKLSVHPSNFIRDLDRTQNFAGAQFNLQVFFAVDGVLLRKKMMYVSR
ncbi:hypothetical protein [Telluribacter sp.]|jgi:hypothetical protein|uniref:hypothetical protein n=1 Tax=Telluribacter sp. TaxID=1978767 RepID=UPI002E106F34|nr:hypothetical protein [Telluribacter sp.]